MKIRRATHADIPHLPRIERSAGEAFRGTDQAWIADDIVAEADAYPPLIEAGGVWVAEDDGVVAGFISTEPLADAFHILELAVGHDQQRKGIGRALMGGALAEARTAGFRAATLTTFRTIPWNGPFYARLGFEILDEPPASLAEILAEEAARGLTDRVAMRMAL
ncbi:MAG: GNAT family N-acetyltransferase [Phenylobacterium sp.]|uniref:GNAT family N-acetyltransferase n=1 Tax=Phenylobacterium sp. TaxID=1871053 RepID=UPI003BB61B31